MCNLMKCSSELSGRDILNGAQSVSPAIYHRVLSLYLGIFFGGVLIARGSSCRAGVSALRCLP